MKKRILGKTGLEVSVFGFGGIALDGLPQKVADELVAEAVDRGVNFFDVGPTYGEAQEKLGPALEPYRLEVKLACKTEPDKSKLEVREDLENSLKLLRTDYFDIYQLHEVTTDEDVEKALAPGGALEAIDEAKRKGLLRFAGFSAHTEKAALALIESYDFETVLFPVNFNCWLNRGMGKQVLVEAEERNMGRMAIKALAKRSWYEDEEQGKTWYKPITDNYKLARAALKFTLSQSVHLAMSPGAPELIRMGLDLVEDIDDFLLTEEEEVLLQKKAEEYEPIFTGDN